MGGSGALRCVRPRESGVRYSLDHYRHRSSASSAEEDHLFIITNKDGCMEGKLMHARLDSAGAGSEWRDVPFDLEGVHLEDVQCFGSHLVVDGRQGGLTAVWVSSYGADLDCLSNARWQKLHFDEASYVIHPSRNYQYHTRSLRLEYTSLVTPRKTLLYDMDAGSYSLVHQKEVPGYDASQYTTERTFAPSRDGRTMIPVSMVRRKGVTAEGARAPAPMLMDSYGSYGYAMDPYFDYKRIALLDRGVVICTPHIRGGNEMGRYWYEVEGKYLNKMNTFFDFIDCAKHMVADGYTTKDQLAIVGRSAGGLLIGATVTLEPGLCKAAVAGVPFVDSLITMSDPTIPLTICEWEGEW
jgi:oligopeptidase B